MVEALPGMGEEEGGGMTNLAGIADEDFKEAGMSSAPTEESKSEDEAGGFDSDEILDDESIDVVGEKQDVSQEKGKVTKEIIEVCHFFSAPTLRLTCDFSSWERARKSPCLATYARSSTLPTSTTRPSLILAPMAVKAPLSCT